MNEKTKWCPFATGECRKSDCMFWIRPIKLADGFEITPKSCALRVMCQVVARELATGLSVHARVQGYDN